MRVFYEERTSLEVLYIEMYMKTITIQLTKHIIATNFEMSELLKHNDIREFIPRDKRHQMWFSLKHSPNKAYIGKWGNEHLFWDGNNHGYVHCSFERATQIRQSIDDALFGNHTG